MSEVNGGTAVIDGNRKYKASVFTLLFSEKEKLIELYNAITGSNYPSDADIEITTLENALFLGRINDIAFKLEDKFVIMIEHQSTLPINLPLRLLLYIARIYETLIEPESVYRTTLVRIPAPEFIVLYNGTDDLPDEKTVRLSEAFIDNSKQNLELTVRILNVNKGRNDEILRKNENLRGYAELVDRVRYNQSANGMNLSEALVEAVTYCREQNILREFLHKHGSGVVNMLFTEFNIDVAKRVWKEDGFIEGAIKGKIEGKLEGKIEGELSKATEMASEMLAENESVDKIMRYTKLTEEQISRLKNDSHSKL